MVEITDSLGQRTFTCFPAVIIVIIVNEKEEVLLLSHPKRENQWEPVNGAIEDIGNILDNAYRETYEEAGNEIKVRPLGTVHVQTYKYDEKVKNMISISYLMKYESGEITPGDDMIGSIYKWFSLNEIKDAKTNILVPTNQKWIYERAIELFRIWKNQDLVLEKA